METITDGLNKLHTYFYSLFYIVAGLTETGVLLWQLLVNTFTIVTNPYLFLHSTEHLLPLYDNKNDTMCESRYCIIYVCTIDGIL